MKAFEEETPVSIRLNPKKASPDPSHWRGDNEECGVTSVVGGEQVPWCENGYYLPKRPNFTMDPLLHAGCYYVQEAASMFLDQVLRSLLGSGVEKPPPNPLPLEGGQRNAE